MEFFNRKEEVLDIELTSHGKQLLSAGKFKPSFYAFYDEDITYDAQYGAASPENQKDSHDRILQTPRIKPNTVYGTVENTFIHNKFSQAISAYEESLDPIIFSELGKLNISLAELFLSDFFAKPAEDRGAITPEKKEQYVLPLPMGTSDIGTQKAPAWQINFLRSELSGSESVYVDGNRAIGFLKFDVNTPDGSAQGLNGVTFTLKDCSKRSYTFSFNIGDDPTSGTCTTNPLLICLDVNDDSSFSTTSNQIAQQVRDKINEHPILITADIPSNDGVVRLRQDASGDIGNSEITVSAPTGDLFAVENFGTNVNDGCLGTDPTFAPLRIPQLFVDVYYDTSVGQGEAPLLQDPYNEVTYYEDGTYIKIDKDYVLLDILEKNVPYDKSNFELEVYAMPLLYDKFPDPLGLTQADELRRLKFADPNRFTKFSTFLYDDVLKKSFDPSPSYSEYFFDITVDDEIQQDLSVVAKIQAALPVNDKELCEDE